jgi:predicted RNase H-like HicB family nuclease
MFGSGRQYSVAVYEAEFGETGYWGEVVDLPGCVAQGETLEELMENVRTSIAAYEETLFEMGTEHLPRSSFTWNVSFGADDDADVGGLVPAGGHSR